LKKKKKKKKKNMRKPKYLTLGFKTLDFTISSCSSYYKEPRERLKKERKNGILKI